MATPEWKALMEEGAFNTTTLNGKEYADWVAKEEARHMQLMKAAGFIAGQEMSGGGGGGEARAAFSQKSAELVMAALFLVFGAIVVFDSVRLGSTWGADGPKPGYFPFYVGLLICIAALVNLVAALRITPERNKAFVEVGQLRMVLTVLIPTAIYAALVGWIGIYVASFLFIGFFMRWLGKYAWWKTVLVSLATMVAFYLVFEIWFKVPLPKGPLEQALGLN